MNSVTLHRLELFQRRGCYPGLVERWKGRKIEKTVNRKLQNLYTITAIRSNGINVLVENRKERENISGVDVDTRTASKYIFWKEEYEGGLYSRLLRLWFSVHSL
jgi:hypothetical protein